MSVVGVGAGVCTGCNGFVEQAHKTSTLKNSAGINLKKECLMANLLLSDMIIRRCVFRKVPGKQRHAPGIVHHSVSARTRSVLERQAAAIHFRICIILSQFLFQHKRERKKQPEKRPCIRIAEADRTPCCLSVSLRLSIYRSCARKIENVGIKFKKLKQRA